MEEQQSSLMAEPIVKSEPILENQPDIEAELSLESDFDFESMLDHKSELNIKSEYNLEPEPGIKLELYIKPEPCNAEPHMAKPTVMEEYTTAKLRSNARSEALGIHIYTSDVEDSATEDNHMKHLTGDADNTIRLYTDYASPKRRRVVLEPSFGYYSRHGNSSEGSEATEATSQFYDRCNNLRCGSITTASNVTSYNGYDEYRRESAESEATSGSDSYVHPSRRQNFEVETSYESAAIGNFENRLASSEPNRRILMTGANSKPLGYSNFKDRPVQHNVSHPRTTIANIAIFSSNRAIACGGKLKFVSDKSEIKQLRRKFKTARTAIAKLDAPYSNFCQTLSEIGDGLSCMTPAGAQDTGGLAIFKSRYGALQSNLGELIAYLKRTSEYFDQELAMLRADLVEAQPINENVLQHTTGRGGKRKSDEIEYSMGL